MSDSGPTAEHSPIGIAELRLAWGVLGVLLLVVFPGSGAGRVWWLPIGLPWILGSFALVVRDQTALSSALSDLVARPLGRAAIVLCAGLATYLALVFSPAAVLFLLLFFGLVLVWLPGRWLQRHLYTGVVGGTLAVTILVLGLTTIEFILRTPRVAQRFGPPTERAAWQARYDSVGAGNIFSFRSPHDRVARAPGTLRVMTLGDSFTWGDKIVWTDSTWPARLERALIDRTGRPVEVINAAQIGWTTANQAEFMRRLGWQFRPDLIIMQFLPNDALPSRPGFEAQYTHLRDFLPARFRTGFVKHSAVRHLVEVQLSYLLADGNYYETFVGDFASGSVGWSQFTSAVQEMADSATAQNTPVVFVQFPMLEAGEWTPETYRFREVNARVADLVQTTGFAVLDLVPVFAAANEGNDWRGWWATPYDNHPNVRGHAVAAAAIDEFLATRPSLLDVR